MRTIEYTKGQHYNRFLTVEEPRNHGTRVTKVVKTKYGFRFQMFNNYITLYYGKLYINANGSAKLVMRVERNYSPIYRYTCYFDLQGHEIKVSNNSTWKELSIYKSLNK